MLNFSHKKLYWFSAVGKISKYNLKGAHLSIFLNLWPWTAGSTVKTPQTCFSDSVGIIPESLEGFKKSNLLMASSQNVPFFQKSLIRDYPE